MIAGSRDRGVAGSRDRGIVGRASQDLAPPGPARSRPVSGSTRSWN